MFLAALAGQRASIPREPGQTLNPLRSLVKDPASKGAVQKFRNCSNRYQILTLSGGDR
jgi:hypothetical protein